MHTSKDLDVSQIDPFMISMNLTDYSPDYSLSFWINTFLKISNNKIYIILFRSVSSKTREAYDSDKIVWTENVAKSKDLIIKFIKKNN